MKSRRVTVVNKVTGEQSFILTGRAFVAPEMRPNKPAPVVQLAAHKRCRTSSVCRGAPLRPKHPLFFDGVRVS